MKKIMNTKRWKEKYSTKNPQANNSHKKSFECPTHNEIENINKK